MYLFSYGGCEAADRWGLLKDNTSDLHTSSYHPTIILADFLHVYRHRKETAYPPPAHVLLCGELLSGVAAISTNYAGWLVSEILMQVKNFS